MPVVVSFVSNESVPAFLFLFFFLTIFTTFLWSCPAAFGSWWPPVDDGDMESSIHRATVVGALGGVGELRSCCCCCAEDDASSSSSSARVVPLVMDDVVSCRSSWLVLGLVLQLGSIFVVAVARRRNYELASSLTSAPGC